MVEDAGLFDAALDPFFEDIAVNNGQPLDIFGNQLPSAKVPDAHIPLNDFQFDPGVFE